MLAPELYIPSAKPQFSEQFHSRWFVDFYHGCGSGPFCTYPYVGNGFLPRLEFSGTTTIVPDVYGWAVTGTVNESSDRYFCDGATITWAPPLSFGTFVIAFRAVKASDDTPGSNRRCYFFYGDKTTGAGNASFSILMTLAGNISAGWATSGATGRITASATGLWAAGELVVMHLIYGPSGQALYISTPSKPANLIGTGAGTPGEFSGANNRVSIGGGDTDVRGCEDPIYYVTFIRHVMTFREIAWTAVDTMYWPFNPGSVSESSFNLLGYSIHLIAPDADISDGSWTTDTGGTTLFAAIDESPANDSDYIKSSLSPINDTCEVSLSNPAGGVIAPFKVRYRYYKEVGESIDLVVNLVQGTTVIATWTHNDIGTSAITAEQILTAPEAAAITDVTQLRLRFTANAP